MKEHTNEIHPNDIAIVGMACHFPKSPNIEEFWNNLATGRECITSFTDEQLEEAGIPEEQYHNPRYVRSSGTIEGIEYFDPHFFEYSPKEAALIDPQQRLFLEQAYQALEDAGCVPDDYQGQIGVYASAGTNTYLYHNLFSHRELMEEGGGYPLMIASEKDFLATRVSYKLNLKGPSLTIQTACSSSLVALHCACQAIRSGECDCAVAGGVSVRIPQQAGYLYQEGLILSPDGHCRAFDEKAQGTVFGSGAGAVVLKLLSDAITDGDCIYAVIKGSAMNNDGSVKAGYTAPGMESQAAAIYEAMAVSGVRPEEISYVETHGTGTVIGDPIEIAALTRAFRSGEERKQFCAIGSVKTNIGHLDTAAGVAGVIKTALMLKHGRIPASLHYHQQNPKIDFANSPFYVNVQLSEWAQEEGKRNAGVSSFGIGGTNVHMILQEAPIISESERKFFRPSHILTLSAQTAGALERGAKELGSYLETHEELILEDVCNTLAACRKTMKHKMALVCENKEEAVRLLQEASPRVFRGVQGESKETVFVFPGQGSQYVNMGKELYETEKIFRENMDECFAIVRELLECDLKGILYPAAGEESDAFHLLQQTMYTQPALFVIEYSLSKLLMAWGIIPRAMAGHSLGEYVAACIAGVFTLRDALTLVIARGKLIGSLSEGSMLAVELGEQELLPLLEEGTCLAAVNSAGNCVASGTKEAITVLADKLSGQNISVRLLEVSHAFHSAMLDPILQAFGEIVDGIRFYPIQIPYLSTCTGTWMTDEEVCRSEYWIRHLRETVRFYEVSTRLMETPGMVFLEVGPGKSMSSLLRRHPARESDQVILHTLPHPKEKTGSQWVLCEAMARLFAEGAVKDWHLYYQDADYRKVRLPGYSFDRRKCWIEPVTGWNIIQSSQPAPGDTPEDTSEAVFYDEEQLLSDTYVPPRNEMETILVKIWEDILGTAPIGIHDNFFELGGTSLMITQIISKVEKEIGRVALAANELYEHQTISSLAEYMEEVSTFSQAAACFSEQDTYEEGEIV